MKFKWSQDTVIFIHHTFTCFPSHFCPSKMDFKYVIGFISLNVERGKLKPNEVRCYQRKRKKVIEECKTD